MKLGNNLVPNRSHSNNYTKICYFYFTVFDCLDSVDWIKNNSTSGKKHKENSTILCWIISHVEQNSSILSNSDLHNHFLLQKTFPHIQALIVNIAQTSLIKHQFYNLTNYGKSQLSKCMEFTHSFDSCHTGRTFCETVNDNFYDFPSLCVVDLDSNGQLSNLEPENDLSQLKHIYPCDLIQQFTDVAISDRYQNGKIECLAYVAGYKDGNSLIGTHLVFPKQQGSASDVNDLGKIDLIFKIFCHNYSFNEIINQ